MGKLAREYEGRPAVGVLGLSNFGGLEVLAVEGDYAVACFNYGEGRKSIGRHKIEYTRTGRPFFRKLGTRYYFEDMEAVY